jgi:hypothetical protein
VAGIIKADAALLAASAAFAGACALGSAVAVREDLPGQPLGIRLPISVSRGLLIGWGAGVAAPWPMPLAALVAASTTLREKESRIPGILCAALGIACIAGTLVEPVTRRPGSWTRGVGAAIGGNLVTAAALAAAGLRFATRGPGQLDSNPR